MNLKSKLFAGEKTNYRVPYDQEDAASILSRQLLEILPSTMTRPIVIVNIGTDRSTGDSLGPLIGSLLIKKGIDHLHVYGTLDDPVHAVNLEEKLAEIKKTHIFPYVIGIDACLGRLKNVGMITIGDGPVKPGAGVNKVLPPVGNIHMTGIVNVSGFMEFFVLQNTRLSLVMKMADTIASALYEVDKHYSQQRTFKAIEFNNRTMSFSKKG